MQDSHLVFLSYASPDRDRVLEWYDALSSKGLEVWMDKRRLKGGQNWDLEIKRALQKAAIIIVFLSENSVDRRGYAQREIKVALDQARDKLIDDIYLIPVMLDDGVVIPPELASIQVIRPEDGDQMEAATEAIAIQLERLGAETARIQGESQLRWTITTHKDQWDGLPGYESSYQLPRFQSEVYPQVGEITQILQGWLASQAMAERTVKFDQDPELCNFGQSRFRRQNSWDASCGDPKVKQRILTVAYTVSWYGAGAAHPNFGFRTFAFTLDPVTQITNLERIFLDKPEAFKLIQSTVREQLLNQDFNDTESDGDPLRLPEDFVNDGTKDWDSFSNFIFGEDGIEFLFGAYEVAPYAFGPQTASVSYDKLAKLIRLETACALGIEYLHQETKPWPFPVNDQVDLEEQAVTES